VSAEAESGPSPPCPRCGHGLRPATVKTAIWRDERLFVVEDIPALVCDGCAEQFYDEPTTEALRRLAAEEFSSAIATREILVPVFSLEGRILRGSSSADDVETDY
jgi:YgiT-type zinc finger domain-containing protein